MKKSIFARSLSLLLALLIAFGISSAVSAEDASEATTTVAIPASEAVTEAVAEPEPAAEAEPQLLKAAEDEPEVITIPVSARVGEIFSFAQLKALTGISPETALYFVSSDGAIGRMSIAEKAGPGTVRYKTFDNSKHFVFEFDVAANPDAVTLEIAAKENQDLPIDEILTAQGYTRSDIRELRSWDTKILKYQSVTAHVINNFSAETHGEGQILLNMNDGQVILLNVTVEREAFKFSFSLDSLKELFMAPLALIVIVIAAPYMAPLLLLVPFIAIFAPFFALYQRLWPSYEYPYAPLTI